MNDISNQLFSARNNFNHSMEPAIVKLNSETPKLINNNDNKHQFMTINNI